MRHVCRPAPTGAERHQHDANITAKIPTAGRESTLTADGMASGLPREDITCLMRSTTSKLTRAQRLQHRDRCSIESSPHGFLNEWTSRIF